MIQSEGHGPDVHLDQEERDEAFLPRLELNAMSDASGVQCSSSSCCSPRSSAVTVDPLAIAFGRKRP